MNRYTPKTTQAEIDAIFKQHEDFLKWAEDKRDSLTMGLSMLACERMPLEEAKEIIFGDADTKAAVLIGKSRTELAEMYVGLHWHEETEEEREAARLEYERLRNLTMEMVRKYKERGGV